MWTRALEPQPELTGLDSGAGCWKAAKNLERAAGLVQSRCMQPAHTERRGLPVPTGFRAHLAHAQPEVLAWLESHLDGAAFRVGCELAARYFEVATRWGDMPRILRREELDAALKSEVESISPGQRWTRDLPIPMPPRERRQLGKLLAAITRAGRGTV